MDHVIEAEGLRKTFAAKGRTVEAVRGVDLQVRRGEIFGFLGPNGAGKTTTLRMLTTLMPIDEGTARVAGCDVSSQAALVREKTGYVSQLGGADELATGRENMVLQGRLYGGEKTAVKQRVEQVIDLLDLRPFADRRVKTYSGGQRRRLDVALGILHEPEALFLDEPTTGLDPQNRAGLWDQVRALRDRGTTVFLTTHYLEEADALCDRVTIIDRGKIVAEGTPKQLKSEVLGDAVTLRIDGDSQQMERALSVCAEASGAEQTSTEGDLLRLYVKDGAAALPQILRLLDEQQISLSSIGVSQPTLDDVFLAKTGRSLRDGDPNPNPEKELVSA